MRIWLDDERHPPFEWTWCRNWDELERTLATSPDVEMISFDHDLGDGPDGYEIIKKIAKGYPSLYPRTVLVHSANPVGAENIEKFDDWYRRMRDQLNGGDGEENHGVERRDNMDQP